MPGYCADNSSKYGLIRRHGPHQVAEKSTIIYATSAGTSLPPRQHVAYSVYEQALQEHTGFWLFFASACLWAQSSLLVISITVISAARPPDCDKRCGGDTSPCRHASRNSALSSPGS